MLKRLTTNDPETRSLDIATENIARLRMLFPEACPEGTVDFGTLRQLVGEDDDQANETYGLTWHGKPAARQLALIPSAGTLRPCPADSVDWSDTQNVLLEGDNLEVLKLLQKSYAGRVKLIYIDPPYNTGKDFIYPDDYRDTIRNYMDLTGQTDGARQKLSSNAESSGRFHTDWLNMVYPRLLLARHLLAEDGVIFISIDENELPTLRLICNELYGDECFVAILTILCNPKGRSQDKYFATNHEYVVVYSKKPLPKGFFSVDKDEDQINSEYREIDEGIPYRLLELRNTHREFGRHNRPNLYYPLFLSDNGGVHLEPRRDTHRVLPTWNDGFEGCWTWDQSKSKRDLDLLVGRQVNGRWKVYRKDFGKGAKRMLKTILDDSEYSTERGQREFNQLFDTKVKLFQSPKSPYLLSQLFETATSDDDLILDFFAGSGTTAHAVMLQNARDGHRRRFMLVQLPEPIDTANKDQREAAQFCDAIGVRPCISELMKDRVRRAGRKILQSPGGSNVDVGFRAFRLDASNIHTWDPRGSDLEQALLNNIDQVKKSRSERDVLYEILLKLGLDLCAPMQTHTVAGKCVYVLRSPDLVACLSTHITHSEVEALACGIGELCRHLTIPSEITLIFRDNAFPDDVAKSNLLAILHQQGLEDIRAL